jgi:predicted MFS family arabinose efflux permease
MIDIVLFSIINMASGFAPNLQTFIGLRAVFGIAMGGEWVRRTGFLVACILTYSSLGTWC